MQKRTLLIWVFLLVITISMAQNGNPSKTILDKTYTSFKASDGIELAFTLSTFDQDNNLADTQSGEAFAKGDRFRLEMEAINVWFDGKTQWVLLKEYDEVNISEPTLQEVASISPLALLGLYQNGVTYDAPVSAIVNGKNVYQIEMTPTTNKGEFQSFSVSIDKTSHTLTQVILTHYNGTKTKIDISKYNANYQYPDSDFTFDSTAYPGVEIVDLR